MTINRVEEHVLDIVESMLDGRIGTVEAAHAMLPLLPMDSDLASKEDFNLTRAIASETDDLPTGRVCEHWHPDSLREKDGELARCEGLWREQMVSACQRIRRTLLLRKLVANRHLSVPERRFVGLVRREEVAAILRSLILANSVFPVEGREGFGYEGASIGRVSSGAQIILSRTQPLHPQTIAERRVERHADLDAAIQAFIDHEWKEGIDGIPLEPST